MKRLLALLISLQLLAPAFAESDTPEGTKVEQPKPAEVIPGEPQKPMDRQKSSAQAKAMALLGSSQSMMACAQMMQAASQAKGSDKALMMMMAQQSCNQGKEMAKAAEENDKSQKQLSAADTPKQAQVKINQIEIPKGSPKEDNSAMATYQVFDSGSAKKESQAATEADEIPVLKPLLPELDLGKDRAAKAAVAEKAEEKPVVAQAPNLPKIAPELIKGSAVTNEGDKKNGEILPNLGPNLNNLGPGIAGNGKSPAEDAKLVKAGPVEEGETRKKSEPVGTGEGSGGGGGPGGSEGNSGGGEKGPDPFEAMLAQIMGGPPPEENGGSGGGGDAELEPKRDRTKPPNLFEYATFRYLKLVDQKKLRNRPIPARLDKPSIPGENSVAKSPKLSKR